MIENQNEIEVKNFKKVADQKIFTFCKEIEKSCTTSFVQLDSYSMNDILVIDEKVVKNIVFSMKNMSDLTLYIKIKKTNLNREDK